MRSFVKGRLLWRDITNDKKQLSINDKETDNALLTNLKFAMYLITRSILGSPIHLLTFISMIFDRLNMAKEA